jgi:hypothetical protein
MVAVQAVQAPLNYGGVGPCLPEQLDHVFVSKLCHFPDTMTRKNARFIE